MKHIRKLGSWPLARKTSFGGNVSNLSRSPYSRRLSIESLEDRRLLAITVNTLVDEADGSIADGDISLRDAIAVASPGETIDFSVVGSINLTLGQITIDKDLTIDGPGANQLSIDASGNDPTPDENNGDGSRVFWIFDSSSSIINVEISDLTLTGGDSANNGGAIRVSSENLSLSNMTFTANATAQVGAAVSSLYGVLVVDESTFSNNYSLDSGGAISSRYGDLTITRSTISDNVSDHAAGGILSSGTTVIVDTEITNNTADGKGGGIDATGKLSVTDSNISGNWAFNHGGGIRMNGMVTILDSTINNNYSHHRGGGVYAHESGTVTITGSTISGNSTDTGGGGIASSGSEIYVSDSTVSGNSTPGHGGGIRNNGGQLSVTNSTVSGNSSTSEGGGIWNFLGNSTIKQSTISGNSSSKSGGGIYSVGGALTAANSTIVENIADSDSNGSGLGGGIFGSAKITNTIVATNFRGLATRDDISGLARAKYSIVGDETGATITDNGGNLIGNGVSPVDPVLAPLSDNGGSIETHALLFSSPALNFGDPGAVAGVGDVLLHDQRRSPFDRVVAGRIDIGAFEAQATPRIGDLNGDGLVNENDANILMGNWGLTGIGYAGGNLNGDDNIDAADIGIMFATWTSSPTLLATATVRESTPDTAPDSDDPYEHDLALEQIDQNALDIEPMLSREINRPSSLYDDLDKAFSIPDTSLPLAL